MRTALTLLFTFLALALAGCGQHSPLAEEVSPTGSASAGEQEWDREFDSIRGYSRGNSGGDYYRYPGGSLRPRESDPFGTGSPTYAPDYRSRDDFYGQDPNRQRAWDDPFAPPIDPDGTAELSEEEQERLRLKQYQDPFWPNLSDPTLETDPYRREDDFFREYR